MEFKSGEFVSVASKELEKHGIYEDSYLYLAGDTLVPETEDDPYLFRKVFIAARVVDYHIQAHEKPFLVNAKHFAKLPESEVAMLQAVYEEDFKSEEE